MRRRHLVEVTDEPWCPDFLRDFGTDFLEVVETRLPLYPQYVDAAPLLADLVRSAGTTRIVDLCSGSGGPLLRLQRALAEEHGLRVHVTLTDKRPNRSARDLLRSRHGTDVEYLETPVDACDVPAELHGLRTVFTAFHHFRPPDALRLLGDAVGKRAPIAVFEIGQRTWPGVLGNALVPLAVLLATPLVRPLDWRRLLCTYLVPVAPLVFAWDAMVSALRCYGVDELREMALTASGGAYRWTAGTAPVRLGSVTWLFGRPARPGE